MMNTATLAQLVISVRAEAGHSLVATQGMNTIDTLKALIARTQIELWTAYQWPTLRLRAELLMAKGQYSYGFPAGVSYEQVREVSTAQRTSASWIPVLYGIDDTMIKFGDVNSESGDPPQFWRVSGGSAFRIWPTPVTSNYALRITYQQALTPMLSDSDMSTIDATAISLFTAAELLARAKAEDAPMKLQKAQKYVLALLGNSISAKRRVSTMGTQAPVNVDKHTPYVNYLPH